MSKKNEVHNKTEENNKQELENGFDAEEGQEQDEELNLDLERLSQLCREHICVNCPEKEEKDNEMLRVKAEADNFRKRMAREKDQFCKYATESVMQDLIPVIDNLELASGHGREVEACSDLIQGIDMTIKIFLDTLKKHGLEKIETNIGDDFDPAWHEAMAEEQTEKLDSGKVCQIVQTGYKLKERVLRPVKVLVSKKVENCK